MSEPFRVLSLGWGTQSFTLAAMAALGEIGPFDAAVHADTLHERAGTYAFRDRMTPWLVGFGLSVIRVADERPEVHRGVADGARGVFIPAFTHNGKTAGQLRRQCTGKWKIGPIRRWLQANRGGRAVELWLGISTDEAGRMKPSDVRYVTNRWPLIEVGMSRKDCVQWLMDHGLPVPPRSACVFCPYHDTEEWRSLMESPEDWGEAIRVDNAIRKLRPPYDLYVHPARVPLGSMDLRTPEQRGQMRLWDEECEGMCGL
jgi:hypothetical protein